MDGWNTKFPFGMAHFQERTVSFREGANHQFLGSMLVFGGCIIKYSQESAFWDLTLSPKKHQETLQKTESKRSLLEDHS